MIASTANRNSFEVSKPSTTAVRMTRLFDAPRQLVLHLTPNQRVGVAPEQQRGCGDGFEVGHVVLLRQRWGHRPPHARRNRQALGHRLVEQLAPDLA